MRSAERLLRGLTAALGLALVVGCESINLLGAPPPAEPAPPPPLPAVKAAAAPVAPASAPAPVAAPVIRAAESDAVVTPAAQRAFDEARRAMRAGRTADAERGFKSLAQLHPELAGPHANLGVLYRQAGKLPESVAELELAVLSSPNQPVFQNQLGISYRSAGQFKKAREAYERAIYLDVNYAAATLNLGILNDLYLADPARALELYERYLALTPAGDPVVTKWIADLKNRSKAAAPKADESKKEKE